MVISERSVEALRGLNPSSLSALSEKEAIVAENPQVLTLKMSDVFALPNGVVFTQFGQELYGILIARGSLSDPGMTSNLREEVALDVKARCKKPKISDDQLSSINEQIIVLIKKRNSEIKNCWPISSLQK